ncbi:hypothetical protein AX16_004865 [Volvariella volvacea WC 439]|nr:hypothetical protein AX16_004865 [Volvariella volvacea WC 439]
MAASAPVDHLGLKISLMNKLRTDNIRNMPMTYPFRFTVTGKGEAVPCYDSYEFNEQMVLTDRSVVDVTFGFTNQMLGGQGKGSGYSWQILLPVRQFPGVFRNSCSLSHESSKTFHLGHVEVHPDVLSTPSGQKFVRSRANIQNALALSIELGYKIVITLEKKATGSFLQYWALDSCGKKRSLAYQMKC